MPINRLSSFYNMGLPGVANSTQAVAPSVKTQTLPNGGGSYNPAGNSVITPAPIFTGVKSTAPVTAPVAIKPKAPQRNFYKSGGSYFYADTNQKILDPTEFSVAAKSGVEVAAPEGTGNKFVPVPGVNYDKYKDPKTGEIMTPEQYAIYLGNKVPKGNGEITNYAGDALTNPDKTAEELTSTATDLNNSRNDIATGTTDPYKVGNQSGVAYSPTELKAIESAYAGVYDPALKDVFARLDEKQAADKAEIDAKNAEAKAVQEQKDALERLAIQHGYSMELKRTPGAKAAGSGSGGSKLLSVSEAEALGVPYGTTQEAAALLGIVPAGNAPTATETDSLIWKWLSVPENAALSEEEKALQIKQNGRNPENFGVYGG